MVSADDENIVYFSVSVTFDCAVFVQYFVLVQNIYEKILHSALQALPAFLQI
jgi:hypothetical protein